MQGYSGGTALGFFMLGMAPGGGPSNMYTHLLDGDMSVSVTMTLLSTIFSAGKYQGSAEGKRLHSCKMY